MAWTTTHGDAMNTPPPTETPAPLSEDSILPEILRWKATLSDKTWTAEQCEIVATQLEQYAATICALRARNEALTAEKGDYAGLYRRWSRLLRWSRQAGVLIGVLVIGFGLAYPAFAFSFIGAAKAGFSSAPFAVGISDAPDAPQFGTAGDTFGTKAAIKVGRLGISRGSEYCYISDGLSSRETMPRVSDGRHCRAWAQVVRHENPASNVEYCCFGGSFIHDNKLSAYSRSFVQNIARDFKVVDDDIRPVRGVEFVSRKAEGIVRDGPQCKRKERDDKCPNSGQSPSVLIERDGFAPNQNANAGKGALLALAGLAIMFFSYAGLIRR